MSRKPRTRRPVRRCRRAVVEQLEDRALLAAVPPPVAWYHAEGDALDVVGGNNGALMGSAGFGPGKVGRAFSLDGQTGFINIPDHPALNFSQAGTYDAWFAARSRIHTQSDIVAKSVNGGGQGRAQMGIWLASDGSLHGRAMTVGGQIDVVGPAVDIDSWHHTALAFDGSSLHLFLDGAEVASQTFAATTLVQTTDPLRIGGDYDRSGIPEPPTNEGLNYLFNGEIDEVQLYNRALTADEVHSIYAAGLGTVAPLVVTTTSDMVDAGDGVLSLREAILASNASVGDRDTIQFNIPGSGVKTISIATALPTISNPVVIDGYTQPGASPNTNAIDDPDPSKRRLNGTLLIQLSEDAGSAAAISGLTIATHDTTVRGLVVNGFLANGIAIQGGSNNIVAGDYIGTDSAGLAARPNAARGVDVFSAAQHNWIGTNSDGVGDASERNLISGNGKEGVMLTGAAVLYNVVAGNYIGTDATGLVALGNAVNGVGIYVSASLNAIGGTTATARNVISGNTLQGIELSSAATGNVIAGNFVGTDATGTARMGNTNWGVLIDTGANGNYVGTNGDGTADAAEGNVISGNGFGGVGIYGAGTSQNAVAGNLIGTNSSGTAALGNANRGVDIYGGAQQNRIGTNADGVADGAERNVISGNGWAGIGFSGTGTSQNVAAGNFIGTDVTGAADLGNTLGGVSIFGGATLNLVGGATASARNIISGNKSNGVLISDSGTSNNAVTGNYIGTDVTGSAALRNTAAGVHIQLAAGGNRIGTDGDGVGDSGEGNVISGNGFGGVGISGSGSNGNIVAGNLIGTNAAGTATIGNANRGVDVYGGAQYNRVGTNADGVSDAAERNVISGNGWEGVAFYDAGTSFNVIAGNIVGTDITGTAAIGNARSGIAVWGGAAFNTVGGTSPAARNVFSGNTLDGIEISSAGTADNIVEGNFAGTDISGTLPLGNMRDGIRVWHGAVRTTIGGTVAGSGNTAAFNNVSGVAVLSTDAVSNAILGNSIFKNLGLGIDLGEDGATANDAGDADTGPNNLQNFPIITAAKVSGGKLLVTYSVPSDPANAVYPIRVQFFKADATGQQGQTFLGDDLYEATEAGTSPQIIISPLAPLKATDRIVATATTNFGIGDTSEFSPPLPLSHPWYNVLNPLDTNGDTHVHPNDALLVINYLNAFGSGFVPDNAADGPPFYDTTGDFFIAPNDAILVINYINAHPPGSGEGEAAADPAAVDAVFQVEDGGTLDLLLLSVAQSQQQRR